MKTLEQRAVRVVIDVRVGWAKDDVPGIGLFVREVGNAIEAGRTEGAQYTSLGGLAYEWHLEETT